MLETISMRRDCPLAARPEPTWTATLACDGGSKIHVTAAAVGSILNEKLNIDMRQEYCGKLRLLFPTDGLVSLREEAHALSGQDDRRLCRMTGSRKQIA